MYNQPYNYPQQQHQNIQSPQSANNSGYYPSSQISSQSQYPFYPPYDSQIDFYQHSSVNPQLSSLSLSNNSSLSHSNVITKLIKSCPICLSPIHIRLMSFPCQHYFCYQCYQDNKLECGYCGSLNSEIVRLNDYENVISCDNHCFKVFKNIQELKKHQKMIK